MIPIKVAFLWHQHQPYYVSDGKFHLPWVRLHTTKDYAEMAEHIASSPKIKATINLVPSLVKQIEHYIRGTQDELLGISQKPTNELTDEEKRYIAENCFHANPERMIKRSERYQELREKQELHTDEEYRDLIIHYALAWLGEFERDKEFYQNYIRKDRAFTEEEKNLLFAKLHLLFRYTLDLHSKLANAGQIELSTTPFYHPILPLLCDTNSAREATPEILLPDATFSSRYQAAEQVRRGLDFMEKRFGQRPTGMWPSEGSISCAALDILAEQGVRWTASDEIVLKNSLNEFQFGEHEKYFPRKYISNKKEIIIFFRDHHLSDKIGFDYHAWNASDAVNDLLTELREIRSSIIAHYGEAVLLNACVSIILDGENCWEYYERNGFDFLQTLYCELSCAEDIETVTYSEAVTEIGHDNIRAIESITAGSWINGNFKIWIGQEEKNKAWRLLDDAVSVYDSLSADEAIDDTIKEEGRELLLKAQGSDWFWWYGDDHHSDHKDIFDELFRTYLTTFYTTVKIRPPVELSNPIGRVSGSSTYSTMHRAE